MEDTSQESFQGSQPPFCIWGAVMGKILNSPNWETVKNEGIQGEILFPFSYKPPHLSPTCSTTSMLKELFGKALKCNNKKKEARRKHKFNRKKLKGNLLTIEMGA